MTTPPISILHLEDSDLDAAIVKHRLDKSGLSFTLERAADRAGFLSLVRGRTFDLILSDYQVPGFGGLEALSAARETCPDTPFIFVSGAMGEDLAVETLRQGATDYVLKDRLTRLPAAIERALEEARERIKRRRIEADLLVSFERFRQLADSLPQMVWVTRADGLSEYFNRRWYEFTGAAEHSTDGDAWVHVLHPEDRERAAVAWRTSVATGEPYEIEYRMRHHAGGYRWILARGLPIRNSRGEIERWFGTCTDVDDQRRLNDELRMHRERLQQMVDERTAELEATHRQLRLTERMAALGTLSAGLGHDMGNLLMPIRVRLESLLRADLPSPLKEDVEAISTSAEYLRRLSMGLRQLAMDATTQKPSESTDLAAWREEVVPMLRNALPRGVTLSFDAPAPGCVARISRAALTQSVFNLVQNAGDAIRDRGAGHVRITARSEGDKVLIEVSDDGPGMSPEVRARCMEPYFTTKTRGISTGMGLSLVYRLLQDAGGVVSVSSQTGEGTTFLITLPSAGQDDGLSSGSSREERAAVVEIADPRLRAVIATELKSLGFAVRARSETTPAIFVLDDPASVGKGTASAPVILLADASGERNGHAVTVVGARPRANELLQALRRAAGLGA